MKFVRHVKKPGWGIGRVLAEDKTDIWIYFEAVGPKKLRKALAELEKIPSTDVARNDILRHIKPDSSGRYVAPPLTFDEMIENFRRIEGGGFDHPYYVQEERIYKEEAVKLAKKLLSPRVLNGAIRAGDHTLVYDNFKKVVQATNLLFSIEKAKLNSVSAAKHAAFAEVLVNLLAGDGPFASRFDALADTFADLGIGSWPTCTYGLFVTNPREHLVVKPLFVQRAAEAFGYEISYDSRPSASTYQRILAFAQYVGEKLEKRGMPPRDMIDVQGFLWLGTGGGDGV